jgi:hypothetical protein
VKGGQINQEVVGLLGSFITIDRYIFLILLWTYQRFARMTSMIKENRASAVFAIATLDQLIDQLAVAGPNDLVVVRAQVLSQWGASLETSPPRPAPPASDWGRPKQALEILPVGMTKLNKMMVTGEIKSKLVGGCRLVYLPSVHAVGDPHARLKRGRPPKSATELVDLSQPAPSPPVQVRRSAGQDPPSHPVKTRRRGHPHRGADAAD